MRRVSSQWIVICSENFRAFGSRRAAGTGGVANIVVRPAREGDEPGIVVITRASIAELCFEDYRRDAEIVLKWLANKTVENVGPASIQTIAC